MPRRYAHDVFPTLEIHLPSKLGILTSINVKRAMDKTVLHCLCENNKSSCDAEVRSSERRPVVHAQLSKKCASEFPRQSCGVITRALDSIQTHADGAEWWVWHRLQRCALRSAMIPRPTKPGDVSAMGD